MTASDLPVDIVRARRHGHPGLDVQRGPPRRTGLALLAGRARHGRDRGHLGLPVEVVQILKRELRESYRGVAAEPTGESGGYI